LREAVGQLLYYAYHKDARTEFSDGTKPAALCAVLDDTPDKVSIAWVGKLRDLTKLNFDLMWPNQNRFRVGFWLARVERFAPMEE